MTLIGLAPDDVPTDDDIAPLRCEVDGCTNTLTYSGRGRKPKYCDEHKSATSAGTSSGKRSTKWPDAEQVEKQILRYLNGLGMAVTWVNPVDGTIIAKGNPAVAHELVELGKIDKTWRKWLDRIAKPGKYGPLAMALAPTVIGIAANHNLLPQFQIPTANDLRGEGVS